MFSPYLLSFSRQNNRRLDLPNGDVISNCGIQEKYRVLFLASQINTSNFNEIKPHLVQSYPNFVQKLCRYFRAPDLTKARHTKLSAMSQESDEYPMDFMERIRQLTLKVYSIMSVEDPEKIAATRFLFGLSERIMP